jgi:hypothetical protein
MKVAVYTCVTNGYDSLLYHPNIPGVSFICFTDKEPADARGWDIELLEDLGLSPRMAAKRPKIMAPQRELADYDYTIWVDGNCQIVGEDAVEGILSYLDHEDFALHAHPGRDCIYEAQASLNVPLKYDDQPVLTQAAHYRAEGHPEHWGLWACGSMARRRSGAMDDLMVDWMLENEEWTIQDQISLPFVLRKHGMRPASFPYGQNVNPLLRICPHDRID